MSNFHVISRERHGQMRWRRSSDYAFAAQEATVPLVAAELPKAVMSLPIAFTEQAGSYFPAAILSLLAGKNLFVSRPALGWRLHSPPAPARSGWPRPRIAGRCCASTKIAVLSPTRRRVNLFH